MKLTKKQILRAIPIILTAIILFISIIVHKLDKLYRNIQSTIVTDRNGEMIWIVPNDRGNYSIFDDKVPENFTKLLLKKEDNYFYYHTGINPIGTTQIILAKIGIGKRKSASTIDQQLTKILLEHENKRTILNKAEETIFAISYDLFKTKTSTLLTYCNSAYFGNHIQGLYTASKAYFDKIPEKLSTEETLQLLVTLSNPTYNNPLVESNIEKSKTLAKALGIQVMDQGFVKTDEIQNNLKQFQSLENNFELKPYIQSIQNAPKQIKVNLDSKLTHDVLAIIKSILPSLADRDAHNTALIILKLPENEIISMIGSPDPTGTSYGQQFNTLREPRQIASTIKPFVYAKAFQMGARPYTLIDDSEYIYKTSEGQTFHLRNYDGKFHGNVTAAYALDNSINIPAVKTLSFVGIDNFAIFLKSLGYTNTQKVHDFDIGVALGTIDMTLTDLAHFYTIFPNQGKLVSTHLFSDPEINSQFFPEENKQIIEPEYTQLVTKILSDRYLAMDQFGYSSDLNIPLDNYALKTGTSDDYRDSWVMGYTPDFLVGVWVGNANNTSTKNLSGQSGAGEIWSQVMEYMSHTSYNNKTPFTFDKIRPISMPTDSAYGLSGDNIEKNRNLFIDSK